MNCMSLLLGILCNPGHAEKSFDQTQVQGVPRRHYALTLCPSHLFGDETLLVFVGSALLEIVTRSQGRFMISNAGSS